MKEEFSALYALERNTIYLFDEINAASSRLIIDELLYLDDKFKRNNVPIEDRIITMQINSPGGSVADGFAIYDTMKYISAKVATVGLGMVASMAAFLLSSGTKGMRCATRNCEILIHQPLGGAEGQASDIIIAANHIEKIRKKVNEMLAENTGQSIERIEQDTDRDTIMEADVACKYGLIDYVV